MPLARHVGAPTIRGRSRGQQGAAPCGALGSEPQNGGGGGGGAPADSAVGGGGGKPGRGARDQPSLWLNQLCQRCLGPREPEK